MDDIRRVNLADGDPRFLRWGGRLYFYVPSLDAIHHAPDRVIALYVLNWYMVLLDALKIPGYPAAHYHWPSSRVGNVDVVGRLWGFK